MCFLFMQEGAAKFFKLLLLLCNNSFCYGWEEGLVAIRCYRLIDTYTKRKVDWADLQGGNGSKVWLLFLQR